MSTRLALIGFSTTGKSFVANELKKRCRFSEYEIIDSDSFVAENILGDNNKPGIARIFLDYGYKKALELIKEYEIRFLDTFKYDPSNDKKYIFALGPWLVKRKGWDDFSKNLDCIWLKKDSKSIYKGLKRRWKKIRKQFKENFPNSGYDNHPEFGCWDIDVLVDNNLKPFKKRVAIEKISELIKVLEPHYTSYKSVEKMKGRRIVKRIIRIIDDN